jgi:hypothetical protein
MRVWVRPHRRKDGTYVSGHYRDGHIPGAFGPDTSWGTFLAELGCIVLVMAIPILIPLFIIYLIAIQFTANRVSSQNYSGFSRSRESESKKPFLRKRKSQLLRIEVSEGGYVKKRVPLKRKLFRGTHPEKNEQIVEISRGKPRLQLTTLKPFCYRARQYDPDDEACESCEWSLECRERKANAE